MYFLNTIRIFQHFVVLQGIASGINFVLMDFVNLLVEVILVVQTISIVIIIFAFKNYAVYLMTIVLMMKNVLKIISDRYVHIITSLLCIYYKLFIFS